MIDNNPGGKQSLEMSEGMAGAEWSGISKHSPWNDSLKRCEETDEKKQKPCVLIIDRRSNDSQ